MIEWDKANRSIWRSPFHIETAAILTVYNTDYTYIIVYLDLHPNTVDLLLQVTTNCSKITPILTCVLVHLLPLIQFGYVRITTLFPYKSISRAIL